MTKPEGVSEAPNKGGRPRKLNPDPATLAQVRGLGQLLCTTKDCAAFFKVCEVTYLKFVKDFPEVQEAYDQGAGNGRISLRRYQFRLAEKNASMAIFLGKNYLDQADKTVNEHTVKAAVVINRDGTDL